MIELRWIVRGDNRELQYRQIETVQDYSKGNYTQWSEWTKVESIIESPANPYPQDNGSYTVAVIHSPSAIPDLTLN